MNKTTTIRHDVLVNEPLDPEVIAFRRQIDDHSPLDEIIHEGARRILQTAIDAEAEVDAFIETHQHRRDEAGCRLVVKNVLSTDRNDPFCHRIEMSPLRGVGLRSGGGR